jgi:hypothetical protein
MMPLALALLWCELRVLAWVLVSRPKADPGVDSFAWATMARRSTAPAAQGAP